MAAIGDARIVIVGGGVIGLGIAYHLAKLGESDVVLVERNQLASGTSWHAAGVVGPLRASMNLTRLAIYATELFGRLEAETGQGTGYTRTGGLWLAQTEDRLTEVRRIKAMGDMTGLHAQVIGPDEAAARAPGLRVDDLAGALWVEEDGQANPVDICMAYAKGARAGGVRIHEGVACEGTDTTHGAVRAVRLSTGETVRCHVVVNCAGVWSRALGAMAGVPVPVQAVEHMYVVTEPMDGLVQPFPIIRDLDAGFYLKGDAGRLVLGGFEPDAKPWDAAGPDGGGAFLEFPEDWEQFEPFMTAGLHRFPALERAGIQSFMNGPEGFTPDTRQAMGESPFLKGYFVAAGFNSIGMMSSAGVGKAMAEWIVAHEPPMDLWEVDVARFDHAMAARSFLESRVREAVANQFAMHWPYKQHRTGRDVRRSALHQAFAAAGAVFGAPTDWERPLWFTANDDERDVPHSYGDQGWWAPARREAEALSTDVAMLELSPFAKFDVTGRGALGLLQHLCANNVDVELGRTIYTQMLNRHGGIEGDVTVTRRGERDFRVVSGAATRWKDLAWIRRAGHGVDVHDATEDEAVIGVMGPRSRETLQSLTDADLSPEAFPFSTSRLVDIAGVSLRATRLSFVGELGWELYIPSGSAVAVHGALAAAGVGHAGHYCLDSCRLEKGYRHWGHDMGPEDSPLEAGLGFAVAWDKPGGFLGREALLARTVTRRLVLFAVDGDAHPLLLHDEPIYRDGELVGRTTSGAYGFRTDLSLCLGTVTLPVDGPYEVAVAGERFTISLLRRPPYDSAGVRLRR
ncbi:MAG: FAD-dependent oxidoreductase [Pseudomonadota bacterium]|nr:FAD-dependent oxidoreductase [Pseudomonadota bacterium]